MTAPAIPPRMRAILPAPRKDTRSPAKEPMPAQMTPSMIRLDTFLQDSGVVELMASRGDAEVSLRENRSTTDTKDTEKKYWVRGL